MATEKYYSKRSEAVKRYNSMKPRTRSEFAEDITNERIMFSLCEMFSAIQPEEDRFDTKLNNIKKHIVQKLCFVLREVLKDASSL